MKKIIGGILGIFLVIGIVAGTGYALYSSTVSVKGASISTAGTGLKIDAYGNFDTNPGKEWLSSLSSPAYDPSLISLNDQSIIGKSLYPGQSAWGHIKLTNISAEEMPLNISAKISSVTMNQDWYDLKDVLKITVCTVTGLDDYSPVCGIEYTINDWTIARSFPGNSLAFGEIGQQYWVMVTLPSNANSNTEGKTISGLEFVITGTQAL